MRFLVSVDDPLLELDGEESVPQMASSASAILGNDSVLRELLLIVTNNRQLREENEVSVDVHTCCFGTCDGLR